MATFATITRWRYSDDAASVRQHVQEMTNAFASWQPPDGVTSTAFYVSADFRLVIGIWEADSHLTMATVSAQFLAWTDSGVIPVTTAEESVAALIAGGLIQPPG
jgi:hypothetical protein